MTNKTPRGIRNNNPFNIKKSAVVWLGECKGDDKVFETFSSLEYGVRAGLKLLANYISNGYDTPRKILNRFAPFTENDTQSYLNFVCHHSFSSPDVPISISGIQFLFLCCSIIRFENGFSQGQMVEYHLTASDLQIIFLKYFD